MNRRIRIGTRRSELALWQANTVVKELKDRGFESEIIEIESQGDKDLNSPIYEMGIVGVFTKDLDRALLNDQIDIAVHSLKDVPTRLPENIAQYAVLKRGQFGDVLVSKNTNEEFFSSKQATIATGSIRRKAQWLHRYPFHNIEGLRGNVNSRLSKLEESSWDGAVFAEAGLKRLKQLPKDAIKLKWMLPAPGQGAVVILGKEDNIELKEICADINHHDTDICTAIEREFLRELEGGCSSPIGALAYIKDDQVVFKGALFSNDGKKRLDVTKETDLDYANDIGKYSAQEIIEKGAKKIQLLNALESTPQETPSSIIVSTKTLSNKFSQQIQEQTGKLISNDFITIRYNRIKKKYIKSEIEHAIFTSQNAVESLLSSFSEDELSIKNIYCVGRRTKKLLQNKLGNVVHCSANAEKLGRYLVDNLPPQSITFFCGNLRKEELPSQLKEKGFELNEILAYDTILTSVKINAEKVDAILFYSPSGVQSYLKHNKHFDAKAICIGQTTAFEAKKHFKNVELSKLPTIESVFEKALNDLKLNSKNNG